MTPKKAKPKAVRVKAWAGFSDGKIHCYKPYDLASVRVLAVYPSRRQAFGDYDDVRPVLITLAKPGRK